MGNPTDSVKFQNKVCFLDENGDAYGIKHADGKMRVSAMPYSYDIAESHIANHSPFQLIGFQPASATSEYTVWAQASDYVFPATAGTKMQIQSSDNTNDKVSGTGALTLRVHYLTTTLADAHEDIVLTGTTKVMMTDTAIRRVNYMELLTTGSTGKAAGAITLTATNTATIYCSIAAGQTISRQIVYTVPLGKSLYLTKINISSSASAASKYVRVIFRASYSEERMEPATTFTLYPFKEYIVIDGSIDNEFTMPVFFPAGTDIKCNTIGIASALTSITMEGWLETA